MLFFYFYSNLWQLYNFDREKCPSLWSGDATGLIVFNDGEVANGKSSGSGNREQCAAASVSDWASGAGLSYEAAPVQAQGFSCGG